MIFNMKKEYQEQYIKDKWADKNDPDWDEKGSGASNGIQLRFCFLITDRKAHWNRKL